LSFRHFPNRATLTAGRNEALYHYKNECIGKSCGRLWEVSWKPFVFSQIRVDRRKTQRRQTESASLYSLVVNFVKNLITRRKWTEKIKNWTWSKNLQPLNLVIRYNFTAVISRLVVAKTKSWWSRRNQKQIVFNSRCVNRGKHFSISFCRS
jgi:hypothetical protein